MAAAGCGTVLSPWAFVSCASRPEFDVIIRGGQIADGLGSALFAGDVGITADRIRAVGSLAKAVARSEIDAGGLVVAPGFVDIHSHTDEGLLRNPRAESKVRQGVTLDVGGNCGDSPFSGQGDEMERLRSGRFALNAALFAGQGSIRQAVLGEEARSPDASELERMRDLVRQAMEQGAVGLSSGLEYMPSGYAAVEEVIALCKVVAEHRGVYATHMRSEDEKLVEAVEEALRVARESGVSLQISHLKAAGKPNWHKTDAVIGLIEKARAEGLDVHCDRYPYLAYSTGMSIFYPGWALEGGREAFVARLNDPSQRRRMKSETLAKVDANGGWETVMVAGVRAEQNRAWVGRRVDEIARELKKDAYEAACDMLVSEGGGISVVGFAMSAADTDRIISLPYVMIASDGRAMSAERAREGGRPHPRSFGTFPRAIREYVREKRLVSMPEMIRKMTSMPADKLGFRDRGRIQANAFADIVVFDADTIADQATYLEPWQYPQGIVHVLVSGAPVISSSEQTDDLPGKLIITQNGV